jgi:hypothetical protein
MYSKGSSTPESDGWILVENGLPGDEASVEVIGRNYGSSELFISEAFFNPTMGWKGLSRVYAWRPREITKTLDALRAIYPPSWRL